VREGGRERERERERERANACIIKILVGAIIFLVWFL